MIERVHLLHNSAKVAEALRRRGAAALPVIDRALTRGAMELHRDAVRRAPKADSALVKQSGVEHHGVLEKHVVFGARYAGYVERGTGPGGLPTLADMVAWVKRRNIQPRAPGMDVESLAYVIRRSIAHKGTPAQPFAGPALNAMRPRLSALVRGATRELLEGRP